MNPLVILAAFFLNEQKRDQMVAAYIARGMTYEQAQAQVAQDTYVPGSRIFWTLVEMTGFVIFLVYARVFLDALINGH